MKKHIIKSIRFDDELFGKIESICKDENRSFSNMIISILKNDERVKNAKVKQTK